ncbi:ABC transporter ATP-binding protein [Paractinoplanes deccanensis]|uniref:ABC transporter ATP-binding protein n=1 Tax=Paractinoplanes deccanensis TaxID=113561 RepID=A0ABQ3XX23_9ACTN|nr:ABC transporter ATP-binding protein [Actinoplanes deccanensis]GID72293.1 ABC transporter ATP-binding protein [Actinoplanes deccanensis]
MSAVLEVLDVTVRFGGVTALDRLTLRHDGGGIIGLIGANGAGKTTLINVLSGTVRPRSGRALLDGRDLTTLRPHRIARAGLARTFQNLQLFGSLSVLDNVLTVKGATADVARRLLAEVGLAEDLTKRPGELPYGRQRRLELARALALEPRLVLLDEPLAGLAGSESDELLELFRRVRDRGITVLLVEHDVPSVLRISDRVLVLEQGALLADGTPDEVAADPVVHEAFL